MHDFLICYSEVLNFIVSLLPDLYKLANRSSYYSIGPSVGISLLRIGNFSTPFLIVGIVCILNTVLMGFFIPAINDDSVYIETTRTELTFKTALKVRIILVM